MSNIMIASIKSKLWHEMRADLLRFAPQILSDDTLMCPACGRFLKEDDFSLEHLVPQQVIKRDPEIIRAAHSKNTRARNLLLCQKPLMFKGRRFYEKGCNSWKGRFFDSLLSDLFTKSPGQYRGAERHLVAAVCLAYLGMVAEYGYAVALMPTGVLLRNQFFHPKKFHKDLPLFSQVLMSGSNDAPPEAPYWSKPFAFEIDKGKCFVAARNFSAMLPLSRDPREISTGKLRYLPTKHALRPNFETSFY